MSKSKLLREQFLTWNLHSGRDVAWIDIYYSRRPEIEYAKGTNSNGQRNYVRLSGWHLEIEFTDSKLQFIFLGKNYEIAKKRFDVVLRRFAR